MKKGRKNRTPHRLRVKNPVSVADEHLHPFPQMTRLNDLPGVGAVIKRARRPYAKNPLSEDEALNLVCDARKNEPAFPIDNLLKKYKDELGD